MKKKRETERKTTAVGASNLVPQLDLIGPSVDDDIRRAINRYGEKAVKKAVEKQTKPRRGRPPIADWNELQAVILEDVEVWLAGGDPIDARSNYSIAEAFAAKSPGQSHSSTYERIYTKLRKKPRDRLWRILIVAYGTSRKLHPHATCIRAMQELSEHHNLPAWARALEQITCDLRDYEAKTGTQPSANLTLQEIEDVARKPVRGMAGFLASRPVNFASRLGPLFSRPEQRRDEKD